MMNVESTHRPLEILRGPVSLFLVLLILVLLIFAAGCDTAAEKEKPVPESKPTPERSINEVMNENVDRIMALDEVVMVAIGEMDNGTPCIQVYVKYKSDALADQIGVEIDGHPVVYIISDEIRPMD
jgi:Na+-transporting methylmalonyl-CoA/oxaloacetate decarboxylase gamma subunit